MNEIDADFLQRFADAWNQHNIDSLMSFMTDDCQFDTGGGSEPWGERYQGNEEVRKRYEQVWIDVPDARWGKDQHIVSGDRGLSEWTFYGTAGDGSAIEVQGCDVFTFRDGKIATKSTYIKNRTA